jgi:thiamine biosynthesis protein ThiS
MISIRINNELNTFEENSTLLALIEKNNSNNDYCAVALNGCFVSRAHYATTILKENDVIDIVTPMQGG